MSSTPPIPASRLRQIATDAANQAIGSAEFYDHAQTEKWNATIINFILKALIAESSPDDKDAPPQYKFAVNSTIVQHLVPTSQLNKSKGTSATTDAEATGATATDGKPHVGRRGMHSATGAYWDETKDGMWTWKYDGPEGKGMDVIVMLLWISTGNQASQADQPTKKRGYLKRERQDDASDYDEEGHFIGDPNAPPVTNLRTLDASERESDDA